jgi:nicotinamide-nucleotide amidase
MRLELINTGTELLLGSVLNTHVRFLAEGLFPLGLRIERQVTLPDGPAIREGLIEAFSRREMVIVTGGLGPTTDDITRDVVAELLGLTLEHDEQVMEAIRARFARRNLEMSPRVALQALRPAGSVLLWNHHGTAPGLYFAPQPIPGRDGAFSPHLFLLPGPPRELYPMFEGEVVPILRTIGPTPPDQVMRVFRVVGMGESQVEERVGQRLLDAGLEVGYCARLGEVDLRLIGPSALVNDASEWVREAVGGSIFAEDTDSLESVVVRLLKERGATVATAESCTGGAIASRLTSVPGASAILSHGYVTYSAAAKVAVLGVSETIIAERTVYSEDVACAMAEGALRLANADYALATTGVAGPDGGSEQTPVGTVYVALARRSGGTQCKVFRYPTDRAAFTYLTTQSALEMLRTALLS